jgi:hypothetical protein
MGSTKHPFDVLGGCNPAVVIPCVFNPQVDNFNRILWAGEECQALAKTMGIMLEDGITRPVCNSMRLVSSSRERCGGPNITGLFISQIECFTRWVANRVVRPGCKAVFSAINRPGALAAGFADYKSEIWITDYIDPRGRSRLAGWELDDIFAAIFTKTAIAVKKLQWFN